MCFQADAFQNDAFYICDQPPAPVVVGGGMPAPRIPFCPPEPEPVDLTKLTLELGRALKAPFDRLSARLGAEMEPDEDNIERTVAELGAAIEEDDS